MNADRITIESDERGFELHVETDEGDRFVFNIHGIAEEVYDHVKAAIGPWLRERDEAWGEFKQALQSGTGPAVAFVCREEDIDESGGYDISDPKHPDHHSVHADIWDAREGK